MKTKNFALFGILLACSAVALTSCSKNDNGPGYSSITSLSVKVESGNLYDFDTVKAVMEYGDNWDEYVVKEVPYANGVFKIDLPETVDESYLNLMYDDTDEEFSFDGVTISDKTVLGNDIVLEAYKDGGFRGDFRYEKSTATVKSQGSFTYVNKDVTIKGSATEETEIIPGVIIPTKVSINVAFKKGWNIAYTTISMSEKTDSHGNAAANFSMSITTRSPGGLRWYFDGDSGSMLFAPMQRSPQQEVAPEFSGEVQKMVSKYRLFPPASKAIR